MKRIQKFLVLVLLLLVFVACGKSQEKIGLGSVSRIDEARAEFVTTVASVYLEDDTIKWVAFDKIVQPYQVDETNQVITQAKASQKNENDDKLKDRIYLDRIQSLEDILLFKSIDDIDQPNFVGKVDYTSVTEELEALKKAASSAKETSGAFDRLGLGVKSRLVVEGLSYSVHHDLALAGFNDEGLLITSVLDSLELTADIQDDGTLKAAEDQYLSKKELKEDYQMKEVSSLEKEWYEQVEFLEDYLADRTLSRILELADKPSQTDEMATGATINISGFKEALNNASNQSSLLISEEE